ncbi:MAG: alpha/beta fold hydrolase [Bdellovibrionota bacterium]
MRTIALHGFLGLPSDWSHTGLDVEAYDVWKSVVRINGRPGGVAKDNAYEAWAKQFASDIRASGSGPVVLFGYSLGGRLAMHALLEAPELFERAVIVSAHPGLSSEHEKRDRVASDRVWADRFLRDPWSILMKAWNVQPVLAPPSNPAPDFVQLDRPESAFSRESLAFALDSWSLGRQKDLRQRIRECEVPMRFVSGQLDTKFTSLLGDFAGIDLKVVPQAGHRVPWDHPKGFRDATDEFLEG